MEGGVHQNIIRKFASYGVSPNFADCALADYRLRHNLDVSLKVEWALQIGVFSLYLPLLLLLFGFRLLRLRWLAIVLKDTGVLEYINLWCEMRNEITMPKCNYQLGVFVGILFSFSLPKKL